MKSTSFQSYVYKAIPLTKAMGMRVVRRSTREVRLRAPLKPNHNHMGTAFGGSLLGLGAVCAWGWLTEVLERENLVGHAVAQTCGARFLSAVTGEFDVVCKGLSPKRRRKFVADLRRTGRAGISLRTDVIQGRRVRAEITGHFVTKIETAVKTAVRP